MFQSEGKFSDLGTRLNNLVRAGDPIHVRGILKHFIYHHVISRRFVIPHRFYRLF